MKNKEYFYSFVLNADWTDEAILHNFNEYFDFNFVAFQWHGDIYGNQDHVHVFVSFPKENLKRLLKYFPDSTDIMFYLKTFDYLKWADYVASHDGRVGELLFFEKP